VFLETAGVYNEIIAHTARTTYFQKDVDTIFEIGGQDGSTSTSTTACHRLRDERGLLGGTGSFLEESRRPT